MPRERATVDVCSGFKLIMFGVEVNVAHVLSSYHLQAMDIAFMFIYILCTLFSMEKLGERLLNRFAGAYVEHWFNFAVVLY